MATHYDVIVLGLGGMGSAALALLAQRGRRVLGLEQFTPAHNLGSSHGDSRVIRQAYFEDPAYVPLLLRAYDLWGALEKATGRHLFVRTGGLMAGAPSSAVVEGSLKSAREHHLAHELLDAAEIRRRYPAIAPQQGEVGLYEPNAGLLFPEEAILAHLQVAVAAGAEARFGVQVTGWQATPSGVRVQSCQGEFFAERLVITAGPWLSAVTPELGLDLTVERNVMHWFSPDEGMGLEDLPVYIVQRECLPLFYGFPALAGQGLKAALHHSGEYTTPESIDRDVAEEEIETVRTLLSGWLPGAVGSWRRAAVCMYTNTRDGHFVIGLHPNHPQVVLAGGFSGHGFKFCSVVGEVLADLATVGATAHPIGLFAPTRFR